MLIKSLLPLFSVLASPAFGASWIVPGAVWTDTDGVKIDAHGGGIFQHENTFYWVGQGDSNSMYSRNIYILRRDQEAGYSNHCISRCYRPYVLLYRSFELGKPRSSEHSWGNVET